MAVEQRGYEQQRGPARATPTPQADAAAFGADIGRAISGMGDTIHRNQVSAYKIERQQQADQEAADFNARFAAAREEADQVSIDARNSAGPGAAGHAQAMADWWDKRSAGLMAGMTETRLIRNAQEQVSQFGGRLRTSEYQYEQGARIGKQVTDQQKLSDLGANRARRMHDDASYKEELLIGRQGIEAMPGVPAEVKEKLLRYHDQTVTVGYLNGLQDSNPQAAFGLIEAGGFDDILTPQQLDQARRGAQVEMRRAEQEAVHAANLAKTAATAQVEEILQMGRDGQPLGQDDIGLVKSLIAQHGLLGKDYDVVKIEAQNNVRRITQKLPPQQIASYRNQMAAKVARAGTNADPADVASLAELDRRLSARRSQLKNDPYAYAAQSGIVVAPLNMANAASVRERLRVNRQLEQLAGEKVPLYQPDEAREVAKLAMSGAAGRQEAAAEIGRWGGVDAVRAAQQVAPRDFGLQHALLIDPSVQRQIFQGEELRKGNPALAPHAMISAAMRDAAGAALKDTPPWYQNGVLYNAGNLYALMAAKQGLSGKDDFDKNLFKQALDLAVDDTGRGGIGTYNGFKVKLPHGARQALFARRIARIGAVNGFYHGDKEPIDVAELKRDYHPVASSKPGEYFWVNGRGEYAVERDGKTPARMNLADD